MKALVVDDSRAIRSIVSRIVRSAGFEVMEAGDGQEALTRLRDTAAPVQLALVDWNMPVMNGLEFVKAARAEGTFADMRIVMVTTETEFGNVQQALEAGASEYLMKPFTKEAFAEKLALLGFGTPAE